MHSFSSESLIVKRRNFGESDKIITLFTKSRGKVTAIAKGVRKINSRRGGNLELLNHVRVFFVETKGMPIVAEAESVNNFKNLKLDLEKISLAYLVMEMVDQFVEEEQENILLFNLLKETLELLNTSESVKKARLITQAFQIKFLNLVGYCPELYQCIKCQKTLTPEDNFVAPSLGGVVDRSCSREVILTQPISANAFKALRFFKKEPLAQTLGLGARDTLVEEIHLLINSYTEYFLEKNLHSREFAERIASLN